MIAAALLTPFLEFAQSPPQGFVMAAKCNGEVAVGEAIQLQGAVKSRGTFSLPLTPAVCRN